MPAALPEASYLMAETISDLLRRVVCGILLASEMISVLLQQKVELHSAKHD